MRRLISLVLTVCLLGTGLCAGGMSLAEENAASLNEPALDEEPVEMVTGTGYKFDFVLRLHPEAISEKQQKKMEGYADLLQSLRFTGSFTRALNGEDFELKLSIIPISYSSGAVDLWIYGFEDVMLLRSSLLGNKAIELSNFSLLAFCAKMSEHLGLPLYYPALLYPYSWKYSLRLIIENCQYVFSHRDENGVISEELMQYLWDCLDWRLNNDEPFNILVDALCKDTDIEEAFRSVIAEIPDYVVKQTAQGKTTQVISDGGATVWRTASGDIYTDSVTDQGRTIKLSWPRMKTGYLPAFSMETIRENQSLSCWVYAQMLGQGDQQDIVNLEASMISFPQSWPQDCFSLLSVNLRGGLLPNIGVACYLSAEQNGHVRVEIRKPTVDLELGAMMLGIEGELLPLTGDVLMRGYTYEEAKGALDVFVSNDSTINVFLSDVVESIIKGIAQFLMGIPTSSCQTIMDDLTGLGVFELLMGQ